MNVATRIPDFEIIKEHQRAAWESGDYAAIGVTMQIVSEHLANTLDLPAGSSVLDIAAGNGSTSLAFARQFHEVVSTDFVDALLEKGAGRAAAEGLAMDFKIADAEALPFSEGTFDAVVSTFGVMFAPNQVKAAKEMLRVVKPGGKIGVASWTPDGFIGQFGKTVSAHKAPPAGLKPPVLWGDEGWVREMFGVAQDVSVQKRNFIMRFYDAQHLLTVFKEWYGPVHKVYATLTDEAARALDADIMALAQGANTSGGETIRIPAEYLEVAIVK